MSDEPLELGEISVADWHAHTDKMAEVSFLTIARRLPSLVRQAMRMAWGASPRDALATISLNLLGGVFTAFGLLATTGVLAALFSQGPTPDRVTAALPSLALVATAAALRTAMQAGAGWAQSRLTPQISRLTEERLYGLTSRVDLVAYDDPDFHDSLERANMRGVAVADSVVTSAIDVVTAAVGITAVAGVLGVLHPVLLPLLLLAVLPDAWAAIRSARMRYMTMHALIPARRRKWIIAELLADRESAAEVRSFTMRGFLLRMYDAVAKAEQDVLLRLARRETVARLVGESFGGLGTGLVYVALGILLAIAAIPLAVAGTAVLAIRSAQQSLSNLMYATNRLYEQGLYFTDFLEFCADAERRLPGPRPLTAPEAFQRIIADAVTFTYPGADEPALCDVSIEIKRGEIVAFVGENGSGKTTLAKILAGLYEPDSGTVSWDETNLKEVSPDDLRLRTAVIAQDHTRWPLTARYNITMGTDKGDAALHSAAEVAGADEVVADLPLGYRTLLDRRFKDGHELSGGQWQRIAVARGFHRDAALLICDEPTAALDARAEHALFERIRGHSDGRTVLLITHRLASVRYADRIYVLEHGKVTEQGNHATLMSLDGLYADLYTLQASAYQ
ncbi:ABC transporter ATP-binding protein [Nonomuraea sp. NEAU-A123]|uniref:ABC transporter ATP-binding protein n=1 Tax=Nonomuraea sp. NEAU-A123 TaxID=2839649 RepID=UPI001BE4139C|nr:ABC transporter ATP-binding protein [Nonomuraea sp. NEAU-A123]MBT2230029.1 ABC transporter ATP-binding protein/permease [Nonomuraea sp. NEAU-A123]MBT2230701.1 ABC transporter ATP-binding protein/permease [Nonomuraea sp. NEAU-A123]